MFRLTCSAILVGLALVGCGGGGSSGSDAAATPQASNEAVGGWTGTTTDGADVTVIVLPSGELWGLVAANGLSTGLFHAPSSSTNGGVFSASEPRLYSFGAEKYVAAALKGTVSGTTFSGSASGTGGSVGFSLAKDARFTEQSKLSDAVGTWSGSFGSLDGVYTLNSVQVFADGNVTANDDGCRITGKFTPMSKSVLFDVTLSYRISNGCAVDLAVRGIAGVTPDGTQLSIGLIKPDRSDAALVILKKSPT